MDSEKDKNQEEELEQDHDEINGDDLSMVFEKWITPQLYTNHEKKSVQYPFFGLPFRKNGIRRRMVIVIEQETFLHTKQVDLTGAVVWDDAVVMAKYIENVIDFEFNYIRQKNQEYQGLQQKYQKQEQLQQLDVYQSFINKIKEETKHFIWLRESVVLELGCGTGALGLMVCGLNCKRCVLTDRKELMNLIHKNINLHRFRDKNRLYACPLLWGNDPSEVSKLIGNDGKADIIFISGCMYNPDSIHLLMRSLNDFSRKLTKEQMEENEKHLMSSPTTVPPHRATVLLLAIDHRLDNGFDGDIEKGYCLPVIREYLEALSKEWSIERLPGSIYQHYKYKKPSIVLYRCYRL